MQSIESMREMIDQAVAYINDQIKFDPKIGIILGTGLGGLVHELLFGHLRGRPVVCMQGRFHYYEGYSFAQIAFPIRVLKRLGIDTLIVSNACGGLNPNFAPGDIMLIKDHINFFPGNPLIGPNDDSIGSRYPDMYGVYDFDLIDLARKIALKQGVRLQEGVYVGVTGPTLETAAEYRMFRIMGADVVGMSTVPEAITARHQGTRVLGFSIVTDMGLPDNMHPLKIEEVIEIAGKAEPFLRDIIAGCVEEMV